MLTGKSIVLGVTGSVSAYKAVALASNLTKSGAEVDVVMTQSAIKFVTPLTFQCVTHRQVFCDLFERPSELNIQHVSLAERAKIVVIAPATANIIAKLAVGIADDLLSCVLLATKAPILIAPAMNVHMYENKITQDNIAKLQARDMHIIAPDHGLLACGESGAGRLPEVERIADEIHSILNQKDDLAGKRIVVTAGGTQEPIDAVRYISNRSSGKMGYALAKAARDRGATVLLITTPTAISIPSGVELQEVETALQMREAVINSTASADALIMAAAVADYRPASPSEGKVKKKGSKLTIELTLNPDIIEEVRGNVVKIGFAAESQDIIENATSKLKEKHLDLIVANNITCTDSGFGTDTNQVILIDGKSEPEKLPLLQKSEVAHKVLDMLVQILTK